MSLIVLENQLYRMEICNPKDIGDIHLYTRFSHCGYITRIFDKAKGKELLGRAVKEFHPFHGEGFPDEFETPLLYDTAAVGESFIKIGVGLEKKLSPDPYTNWDEHPITKRAVTEVTYNDNTVTFIQKAECDLAGYEYRKSISLSETEYIISHCLKNTGITTWSTLWYSHAFLPAEELGGKVILLKNPGGVLREQSSNLMEKEGKAEILIGGMSSDGECFQWDMESDSNFQLLFDEYDNRILEAAGDYAYQELQVYVNDRIISVEPKLRLRLEAGEQKCWSTKYKL